MPDQEVDEDEPAVRLEVSGMEGIYDFEKCEELETVVRSALGCERMIDTAKDSTSSSCGFGRT